jgi:glutamyl-tRNA reductase
MPIITIGLSHRTCAVDVRERFAFSDADIPAALTELKARGLVSEGVIVSTCNRMEIYAVTNSSERKVLEELRDFIVAQKAYNSAINGEFYLYSEPQSLEHLFKVACGMDSMLLGETEILGQLKKAYDLALQHKHTGAR